MENSRLFAQIRSKYTQMTCVERIIADYILSIPPTSKLNPTQVAETLYVSKASLSRFAQKLGFHGFQEFIYHYAADQESLSRTNSLHLYDRHVCEDYAYILSESQKNIDGDSLKKAVDLICHSKRILIYGDGLSGYSAKEFMIRFKRLGFLVEAYTDDFMMQTNSAMAQSATLVIGISLSGNTRNTILGLKKAQDNGAKTLLITSLHEKKHKFDAVLYAASLPQMNTGMFISPQVPILFIIDLLFSRVTHMDESYILNYHDTLTP